MAEKKKEKVTKKKKVVAKKATTEKKTATKKAASAKPTVKKATASQIKSMDNLSKLIKKWHMLRKQHKEVSARKYVITGTFEANTPIIHQNMGWGFIISEKNDRLEVLFESGLKMLISNYNR